MQKQWVSVMLAVPPARPHDACFRAISAAQSIDPNALNNDAHRGCRVFRTFSNSRCRY